jgi:hypothetical protein
LIVTGGRLNSWTSYRFLADCLLKNSFRDVKEKAKIGFVLSYNLKTALSDRWFMSYGDPLLLMTLLQDAGVTADCVKCVQETIEAFGGIDIIIGNAV